ncbi:hypothetical protein HW932_19605 [Allochromatium humboldtianum]|uniref:Uncharacterized protein n=1 Tax=Allochromatium humboldtianum TaxID=504901 RepID=A0A850RKQ1_9GAMM|nr:hypothetical protein [Allochromatium humboldtianum]NVZ11460.1 hypothetical protein [Allochromatium humboldtianum]
MEDTHPTPDAGLAAEAVGVLALASVALERDELTDTGQHTERLEALERDLERLSLSIWQGRPVRRSTPPSAPPPPWLSQPSGCIGLASVLVELFALEAIGPETRRDQKRLAVLERDRRRLSSLIRAELGKRDRINRRRVLIRPRTKPRPLPPAPAVA